ncbi:MAG: diacylglycerol kinase [bacterium]|nr:diacylglycerol kinase [bacterium]
MVAITPQSLHNSFRYALRGLAHTFRTQQSFRIQVFAAVVVLVAMLLLGVTTRDAVILIVMTAAVLVLELINTVVEHLTDLVSARLSPVAQAVKDAMAAAVFVASIIALVVGLLIFWPYLATAAS